MFAVPGWSVSPGALKTQTIESPTPATTTSVLGAIKKNSNAQRKRKHASRISGASEDNSTNLLGLWETVIEKKPTHQHADGTRGQLRGSIQTAERPGSKFSTVFAAGDSPSIEEIEEQDLPKLKRPKPLKSDKRQDEATKAGRRVTVSEKPRTLEQPLKSSLQFTPLQISMKQKLISARFRYLNQTLYTSPSLQSLDLFQQNPEMFQEYHEGFRRQVEVWPENPVDSYIEQIRERAKPRQGDQEVTALPRTGGTCRLADLGCGDAAISKALDKEKNRLRLHISSYDLQKTSHFVTKADIANLPLPDGSIDVAIFCLALMGTNWIDFIEEAFRVVRWKGELWVAEIRSRFGRVGNKGSRVEHSVGNRIKPDKRKAKIAVESGDTDILELDGHNENGQTDVSAFIEVLRKRGFILRNEKAIDLSNKMFVRMSFVKGLTPIKGVHVPIPKGMAELGVETWKRKAKAKFIDSDAHASVVSSEASILKPCVYKLR